uniref:Uncharacterized protein n=1 Tax=uncultured microorganism TaxID=358574 RepID=I2FJL6_9ZZZZ|nr:hypothetical protein [uncultured microorganism]
MSFGLSMLPIWANYSSMMLWLPWSSILTTLRAQLTGCSKLVRVSCGVLRAPHLMPLLQVGKPPYFQEGAFPAQVSQPRAA